MQTSILTDIPEWVRPLAKCLESMGCRVQIVSHPEEVCPDGLIVNRVSTLLAAKDKRRAERIADSLRTLEGEGRAVVNGAHCFEIGCSKSAQAILFEACGVRTPPTASAVPGGRALPGRPVLLKPAAGGYGEGIQKLAADEPAPNDLFSLEAGWIEQELLTPADGCVHRIEILGSDLLYEARSPVQPDQFNYCLAHPEADVTLRAPHEINPKTAEAVRTIARAAKMELGAVEYLLDDDGAPIFIDLNPVSSLHPGAAKVLGQDPLSMIATYLVHRSADLSSKG
jgi:glutathione synthase/RimK-type ligase-like ATP-grasp enzyme